MKRKQRFRVPDKERFDIGPDHPMYCCRSWIDNWINHPAVPVSYRPDSRQYYIMCDDRAGWVQTISHCISCNHKFPEILMGKRSEILQKEYGFDLNTIIWFSEKLPEEFRTEEWWRKRGL